MMIRIIEESIMRVKSSAMIVLALVLCFTASAWAARGQGKPLGTVPELGSALYFDEDLSILRNQACASCHFPAVGFDDPDSRLPVSQGSFPDLFGGRNAPSAAYAAFAPKFHWNEEEGLYFGGQFWDGRKDSLALQAEGPPLNPVEMAMPGKAEVLRRIAEKPHYVRAFRALFRFDLSDPGLYDDEAAVEAAYAQMAVAIGEFERTRLFNKFNSRFDHYLAGRGVLTPKERRGLELYNGRAQCALCHPLNPTTTEKGDPVPPLMTDFSYDNLGIPVNPEITALAGRQPIDYGLGARTEIAALSGNAEAPVDLPMYADADTPTREVLESEAGKFKVMTLRNIAKTAPYGHNGYFKTLKSIVHFYNTRDILGDCAVTVDAIPGTNCWPAPEVGINVNDAELGDLGLTPAEEDDLVAFLKTLTDQGASPSPYGNVQVPPMP